MSMTRVRRSAACALLAAFLVTTQAAPVAHLVTHRPDHTHGPEIANPAGASAHAAAHAAGRAHAHQDEDAPTHDELAWLFPGEQACLQPAGETRGPAGHDHGHDSASHLDLALLQAPPPPLVPAPAEALAAPPDVALTRHAPPAADAPTARGPPARPSPVLHVNR